MDAPVVDFIATKRLIGPSLGALAAPTTPLHATPAELITRTISTLVKQAIVNGDVRKDIDPSDLLRALVGMSYGNPTQAGKRARGGSSTF